ncbi:MAG: cob(I)yrinic acid a,c-diamide adenosyltransferase [Clostridia bacterium]|nr:cob(I)yrinic acid a,c-diamide adenosyltransferase [Clostridia bacterium]
MKPSLIHIYKGDGKGKTTAAMGLAARALGAGLRVAVACFLKDGSSSELTILRSHERCTVLPCPSSVPFSNRMSDEERLYFSEWYRALTNDILRLSSQVDVLILDEVLDAIELGFVEESAVVSLCTADDHPEIVLTGHHVRDSLLKNADYITTMQADRHPFSNGIVARHGIEY